MKKLIIIVMLLLSTEMFSKLIHPVISMDKIYSSVGDGVEYPKDNLEFRENNKDIKVVLTDSDGTELCVVDKYKKNTKILSVFFYDASGDGQYEFVVITKYANKNNVCVYGFENQYADYIWENPDFVRYRYLENRLNKKFLKTLNLTAKIVKKELETYYPIDLYGTENVNDFQKEFKNRKINFSNAKLIGYFDELGEKINESIDALYYVLKTDKSLYANFYKTAYGFSLEEIYEAYEKNNEIIKNGKFVYIGMESLSKENYKDGVLEGEAYYEFYGESSKGKYVKGEKDGEWVEENFKGLYSGGKRTGKWTNIQDGINRYYENNLLKKEEYFDIKSKEILKEILIKDNKGKEEYRYSENGELEQKLSYDENNRLIEGINCNFFKNSMLESYFKSYDLAKSEYLGTFYPVEKNGEILDLNSDIDSKMIPYTKGVKLFSIKKEDKEIFIVMVSESGYFGVKEIFEGFRKNEKINSLKDLERDGRYELFDPNSYYSPDIINRDEVILRGDYKNSKKNGTWERYRNDEISERVNYSDDKLNGLYQKYQWPYNHLVEEGNYENNQKVGKWEKYPILYYFSE